MVRVARSYKEIIGDCPICHIPMFDRNPKTFVSRIIRQWYPEKENTCTHKFCSECVTSWYQTCLAEGYNVTCPVCRFEMMPWTRMVWYYTIKRAAGIGEIKNSVRN